MIKRGATLGSIGMLGLLMAASAGNYFITPMSHPDDGAGRVAFAVIQVLVGAGLAVWAYRRVAIESRGERPAARAGT